VAALVQICACVGTISEGNAAKLTAPKRPQVRNRPQRSPRCSLQSFGFVSSFKKGDDNQPMAVEARHAATFSYTKRCSILKPKCAQEMDGIHPSDRAHKILKQKIDLRCNWKNMKQRGLLAVDRSKVEPKQDLPPRNKALHMKPVARVG
jgi:hypothetical protein